MTDPNFIYQGGPQSANLIQSTPALAAIPAGGESQAAASGSYFAVGCYKQAVAVVNLSGTWSASLIFEGSLDGSVWFTVNGYDCASFAGATTPSSNGQWIVPCAGFAQIRVRCTAFSTGTIVVTIGTAPSAFVVPNI